MKRFLPTLAALLILASPVAAEKLSLNSISNYFQSLKLAESPFTQISADGYRSTGMLFISRPGKMRFDYNPPENAFVVATAGAVYIVDGKSNARPETYPLRRTPLNLLLARNVNLTASDMVVGHDFDGQFTIVTAQDPKNRDLGFIRMYFSDAPIALKQWVVVDGSGQPTTVVLDDLVQDRPQGYGLYDIPKAGAAGSDN